VIQRNRIWIGIGACARKFDGVVQPLSTPRVNLFKLFLTSFARMQTAPPVAETSLDGLLRFQGLDFVPW